MKKLLSFFLFAFNAFFANAQMVGTNVFLKGAYIEVGMNKNGSLGACNSHGAIPAGYHPVSTSTGPSLTLAAVHDYGCDGWTTGSPAAMLGDFFATGSWFEGWELQVGASRSQAFGNCTGAYTSAGLDLTGAHISYSSSGGVARSLWLGTAVGGQLAIQRETRIDTLSTAVIMSVKLKNNGAVPMPDVYYLRSNDPDIDHGTPSGGYATSFRIIYQNDSGRSIIRARGAARGEIALGAVDSRAKVFKYASWPISASIDLASVWVGMPGFDTSVGCSVPGMCTGGDIAMGLLFNLGTINPGDSVQFSYAYKFDTAYRFDTLFNTPCSGTPVAGAITPNTDTVCATTHLVMSVPTTPATSGIYYQWQASPDGVVWSSIPAASSHIFDTIGVAATTFFRCIATCIHSGLSDTTLSHRIVYATTCPCIFGPAVVNTTAYSACPTSTVTLTYSATLPPGALIQWQSSTDSVSWAPISGATFPTYTFSGHTATRFYRCVCTCPSTGGTSVTHGRKVAYTSSCACAGMPIVGATTASTSFCSSCSLTLGLSPFTAFTGYLYQWQRSLGGASGWTNMPGATTLPYTYAPDGAFYYRCRVICPATADTAFSYPVYVDYAYRIISDTAYDGTGLDCNRTFTRVVVNGEGGGLDVITYYGDGTIGSSLITTIPGGGYTGVWHNYNTNGWYTIKHVLTRAGARIDSVTRSYHKSGCRIFNLRFYIDRDMDCVLDDGEPSNALPIALTIDSAGTIIDTVTVLGSYYYRALGAVGTTYTFRVLSSVLNVVCPSSGDVVQTLTSDTVLYPPLFIPLYCSSTAATDMQTWLFKEKVTPQYQVMRVYARNNECAPQNGIINLLHDVGYNHLLDSWPTATSWLPPAISWSVPHLSLATGVRSYWYKTYAPPTALLTVGDTVVTNAHLTPVSVSDADTTNNRAVRVDTVRASWDPNMIEVNPPACFEVDTQFTFTVHFENLGNDTAHNVYVLDTLSPYLDLSTLKLVMSSAPHTSYSIYQQSGYNVVRFDFPNIRLADSSQDHLNDGVFIYTIRNKSGMALGQQIISRVGIYFDYNEVVMTNAVVNTKGCPPLVVNSVVPNSLKVYPNPVSDKLTIAYHTTPHAQIVIADVVGRTLLTCQHTGAVTNVDVAALSPGLYYLSIINQGYTHTVKFVKN